MTGVTLNASDAAELAEMLQFVADWLNRDPGRLRASLEDFVGHPAYNTPQLREDLERFIFLLGGSDGESLFGSPQYAGRPRPLTRPAEDTPGLHGVNVVRPRAARCGRSTLIPVSAPALIGSYPGKPSPEPRHGQCSYAWQLCMTAVHRNHQRRSPEYRDSPGKSCCSAVARAKHLAQEPGGSQWITSHRSQTERTARLPYQRPQAVDLKNIRVALDVADRDAEVSSSALGRIPNQRPGEHLRLSGAARLAARPPGARTRTSQSLLTATAACPQAI